MWLHLGKGKYHGKGGYVTTLQRCWESSVHLSGCSIARQPLLLRLLRGLLLHTAPQRSTPRCSTVLHTTLLHSAPYCSTLLSSTVLHTALLHSAPHYTAPQCSALLHTALLHSVCHPEVLAVPAVGEGVEPPEGAVKGLQGLKGL